MKLAADVRTHTRRTAHRTAGPAGFVDVGHLARRLIIETVDGGASLYRLDEQGTCVADTWHASVDEAKQQAAFEYAIREDDWQIVPH